MRNWYLHCCALQRDVQVSAHILSCSTDYLAQNECLNMKFGAVDQLQLSLADPDRLKTPRKCSVSTHFKPLTMHETDVWSLLSKT